jgi:hypothetical protein
MFAVNLLPETKQVVATIVPLTVSEHVAAAMLTTPGNSTSMDGSIPSGCPVMKLNR